MLPSGRPARLRRVERRAYAAAVTAHERRTSPWIWAIVGLAAAALAVAVVMLVTSRDPTTSGGGPSAPAAPSGKTTQPPGAAQPGPDTAWWRMRADPTMANPVLAVEVGTLGGGVAVTLDAAHAGPAVQPGPNGQLSAFPARVAVGPAAGWVVVIGTERSEMVLTAAHAATGETREVARTADVVVDAALVADGMLVFITADPPTGALTGAWRVDVAGAGVPEAIAGLVAAEPSIRLAARAVPFAKLLVSPDGSSAAVLSCSPAACEVRAIELAGSSALELAVPQGEELIGLAGHLLIVRPVCQFEICQAEMIDLATGERGPLPGDGWLMFREALIGGPGGPLLVAQESGALSPMAEPVEDPSFTVIDLTTRTAAPPVGVGLGAMSVVAGPGYDMGVELPAGWFMALGSPPIPPGGDAKIPMGAYAVEASTGRAVPLPALGEFFMQG